MRKIEEEVCGAKRDFKKMIPLTFWKLLCFLTINKRFNENESQKY